MAAFFHSALTNRSLYAVGYRPTLACRRLSILRTETQAAKNSMREALKKRLNENGYIDFVGEGDRIRVFRIFGSSSKEGGLGRVLIKSASRVRFRANRTFSRHRRMTGVDPQRTFGAASAPDSASYSRASTVCVESDRGSRARKQVQQSRPALGAAAEERHGQVVAIPRSRAGRRNAESLPSRDCTYSYKSGSHVVIGWR